MQTVTVSTDSLMELVCLQLKQGGRANLMVTGSSMLPWLREERDTVLLSPINGDLLPGDVALYRRDNGRYLLHRVISLTPEGYLFCGDNQAYLEPVRQDQLLALMIGYTRKGKVYDLNAVGYRLYSWIWLRLFCLRKSYIRMRRRLGRMRRRFLNRRKRHG